MAMKQRYLIWLDILGFKDLVEKIAKESYLEERKVRTDFINVINERVTYLESQHYIIGKNYGERDDWLLVASSLDSVFKVVHKILDHNTGYRKHKRIPLEIAVGVGEYDKWARFDGARLVVENSTVENLKMEIVKHYHRWYSQKHDNKPPKCTFIILTRSAYGALEPLDRRMCKRIDHKHISKKGERGRCFFRRLSRKLPAKR